MIKKALPIDEAAIAATLKKVAQKFPHLLGELNKQGNTAMYYGFIPVKTPHVTEKDRSAAEPLIDKREVRHEGGVPKPLWTPEERISILRMYSDNEMHELPQPIMLYYRRPFGGAGTRKRDRDKSRDIECGLDIVNNSRSICDALVIQAAYAILREEGFENLTVEINSIGERDTIARHERELGSYFKKHANTIPLKWRPAFKYDPFSVLTCTDPECDGLREAAPKSVSFLSEVSRRHFMEVLDYMETLEIPYRINHSLIAPRTFATQVIFEIRDTTDESCPVTLATGSRYNAVSKKIGFKKEVPSVGASILYKRPMSEAPWKPITNPKFYFIQLGDGARMKSLKVLELLRRSHIAVHHSLTRDKLVSQMTSAENLKVPYLILMGQKEALENSVVVRNLNTRAQETVDLKDLVTYLKKLK